MMLGSNSLMILGRRGHLGLLSGSWDTDQRESWSSGLGRTGTCKGGENEKEGEACGGSPDHDKTHQLPPNVTSRKCEHANVTGETLMIYWKSCAVVPSAKQ